MCIVTLEILCVDTALEIILSPLLSYYCDVKLLVMYTGSCVAPASGGKVHTHCACDIIDCVVTFEIITVRQETLRLEGLYFLSSVTSQLRGSL